MRYGLVILVLLPAALRAADAGDAGTPGSRYSQPAEADAAPAPHAGRPVEHRTPGPTTEPLNVDRRTSSWRLEVGYGQTKEGLHYKASASADSPTLPGYASTSTSSSSSLSAPSQRLNFGPMYGVHPGARGYAGGFLWGVDIELANYVKKTFTLPATDADTTASSANGTTFQSISGVQTLGIGLPVGWSFDLGGHLALETVGVVHLGVLHTSYTSGENLVYGRGAPLDLFSNDLYDLYGDAEAKVRLAWRLESGLEFLASAGYFYGVSLSGTSRDAVTYYQGSGNAQAGSYSEKVGYRLSGATVALGLGYSF